jgi:hypothetical protein
LLVAGTSIGAVVHPCFISRLTHRGDAPLHA